MPRGRPKGSKNRRRRGRPKGSYRAPSTIVKHGHYYYRGKRAPPRRRGRPSKKR